MIYALADRQHCSVALASAVYLDSHMADSVKSFGRLLAFESLRRTNPRSAVGWLWGLRQLAVRGLGAATVSTSTNPGIQGVLTGQKGAIRPPVLC
jgi:hypothetical protein